LYPEARQKLEQSGLDKRLVDACKQESLPSVYGALYPDEFRQLVDDMKERGFYRSVPKAAGAQYFGPLQDFAGKVDQRKCEWVVKHHAGEVREHAENEDFLLLSGYLASHVLTPEEFWSPEHFGFSSIFGLFGTIGASAWENAHLTDHREGYVWNSQAKGRLFSSQVTGDSNGDFRLYRTDLTPYETTDPLGNKVPYRPELLADHQSVSACHSTELELLVAVLKYVEQEKLLATNLTQQGLDEIADELKRSKTGHPNYADFGMGRESPMLYFGGFTEKMPRIDEQVKWNPCRMVSGSNGDYVIYVGPEKELIFRYESREKGVPHQLALELPAEEIDHLIKGIIVQAHGALGRTSLKQVLDVISYYFSPQFKEDQKRLAKS
jgi:hypothetical protein